MNTAYEQMFREAHAAGLKAGAAAGVVPMIVQGQQQTWVVPDGACGFAWITIRPGTSRLARAAKQYAGARKAYGGGVQIWVSEFGQSVMRKEAYAAAYAEVLRRVSGESEVYAEGRLD